jgi:hypothetical protein
MADYRINTKHEPKTMKAKADLMLKKGSISEKEHKRLHAKADGEIAKEQPPVKTPLSAKGDGGDAASDVETGKDTPAADDPSLKTRKPGKANVMRGEPADPDL